MSEGFSYSPDTPQPSDSDEQSANNELNILSDVNAEQRTPEAQRSTDHTLQRELATIDSVNDHPRPLGVKSSVLDQMSEDAKTIYWLIGAGEGHHIILEHFAIDRKINLELAIDELRTLNAIDESDPEKIQWPHTGDQRPQLGDPDYYEPISPMLEHLRQPNLSPPPDEGVRGVPREVWDQMSDNAERLFRRLFVDNRVSRLIDLPDRYDIDVEAGLEELRNLEAIDESEPGKIKWAQSKSFSSV